MPDPDEQVARPPGGPPPPAPPGVADPGRGPDPSDPGPPIPVRLDEMLLGDLGHARVDSRLVVAILLRNGEVARWLRAEGVEIPGIQRDLPDARWPLQPTLGRPGADEPDLSSPADIDLWLADQYLGQLGDTGADARLLSAILARGGRFGRWLEDAGIGLDAVDATFPL